jgi:CRP-like cAMP-binding protein
MNSHLKVTQSQLTDVLEISQHRFMLLELPKNEFLVRENQVCPYFCFIESGLLQHAIDVNGEEKTTYLSLPHTFTVSLHSFLHQLPSRKHIKTLSDCRLWVIDLPTFQDLIANHQPFHDFYFQLIERQICLIDEYRIDLLTLSPEERYLKLLQNDTVLIQQVPLHYLASFLGISNRHMSRIRKNIK